MVETKSLIESEFIGVEYTEQQTPPVIGIIQDEGIIATNQYSNTRLQLNININNISKKWSVNQRSNKNIANVFGTDTKNWVGKKIRLEVTEINKKKAVVGFPLVLVSEDKI